VKYCASLGADGRALAQNRLPQGAIRVGLAAVTRSFPFDMPCILRCFPRSRRRDRAIRCRGGTSGKYIRRQSERSHTVGRHRRTSCDETREKTPVGLSRKPGTPIVLLQSEPGGTPQVIRNTMFNKARRDEPVRRRRGRKAPCSACERRRWSSTAAAPPPGRCGYAQSGSQGGRVL
jgi:hypothetical protein